MSPSMWSTSTMFLGYMACIVLVVHLQTCFSFQELPQGMSPLTKHVGHQSCAKRIQLLAPRGLFQGHLLKARISGDGGKQRDDRTGWRSSQTGGDGKGRLGLPRAYKSSNSVEGESVELTKTGKGAVGSQSGLDYMADALPGVEPVQQEGFAGQDATHSTRGEPETTGESFWIEYQMRVVLDSPYAAPFVPPTQAIDILDAKKARGEVSDEEYAAKKKEIVGAFWSSLIDGSSAQRNMQPREIRVQVTNDAAFANSWVEQNINEAGETELGISVQWVPVSSQARGKRGGQRKSRHRISVMQLATHDEVLVLQMAHLKPSKVPKLVSEVLSNPDVVKHGHRILEDSIKIERDWGTRILARVDSCEYADSLGYDANDICQVAQTVLALNYTRPEWVARSDWEALTLSEMQISCAALDAWVSRESTLYVAGVSQTRPVVDCSAPQAALAERGINTQLSNVKDKDMTPKVKKDPPRQSNDLEVYAQPDKVMYIPKVDVRDGGDHAHWLWRGTRVSDKHIARYCGVKLELDDTEQGTATIASLWGPEENVKEAVELMANLLARSQLESEYFALGLGPPQFINRPDEHGGMSSIVILNTMEPVEWSFFPSTLTKSFPGRSMKIRGKGMTKDVARAAFFSQAHAASAAADAMLGKHRPKMIQGPLPAGLDPGVMWRSTGYTL